MYGSVRRSLVLALCLTSSSFAFAKGKAKAAAPATTGGAATSSQQSDMPDFESSVPTSAVPKWDPNQAPPPEKPMLAHPIPSLQETRPGQPAPQVLTIEKSVEEAIRAATNVQKAFGDYEISGEQLAQSYAQFLPNLVASGTANRTQGTTYFYTATPTLIDATNHGIGYTLTSTINIFNGFSDLSGWRASMSRKTAANLNLRRAKQQIALDVSQTYLQVILDQELVKIAKENLVASNARESLLSEQTRVGVRNLADLFRQQAQTSSDESFLADAESKERTDELLLLRKLRYDASKNYKLLAPKLEESAKTNEFDDENNLVKTALENRPDLTASERGAKAAEWDVTQQRSQYYPHLDFGASMGSVARTIDSVSTAIPGQAFGADQTPANQLGYNDQLSHQIQYTFGLTLTWNIFDRWVTETNVERAKVNARNTRLDAEDRHIEVVSEIRQAFGEYKTVLQKLESTKKGLMAARKAYEVMQGRYQVGSASFVDLDLAQAALVQAEAARAQALIAFALQRRTLETALGTVAVD